MYQIRSLIGRNQVAGHNVLPPIQRGLMSKSYQMVALAHRTTGIDRTPRFTSDLEIRYFRIFCDDFATDVSGLLGMLWKQLIPQESEMELFLRDALVAAGALTRAHNMKATSPRLTLKEEAQTNGAHRFALSKYNQSLQGLSKAANLGTMDLKTHQYLDF